MATAIKKDLKLNPYNVELHLNAAEAELVCKLVGICCLPGDLTAENIYSALNEAGVENNKYMMVPDYIKAYRV